MSELAERLNSLIDSRASELDVDRQIVIREMAKESDLGEEDIEDLLDGDLEVLEDLPVWERRWRVFTIFGEEAASELTGLYFAELSEEQPKTRQPQIREVIPRSTYESLQAIKKELSQALAD